MRRKSTEMPAFKSEAEEADWYATPAGRRQTQREFERAIKEGTLMVNPQGLNIPRTDPKILSELLARAKEKATQAISLRVSVADIEAAKKIAANRGVGYQTVLKQAIRDGLKKRSA
jgi:ABC-type branched-subunit amino acid transport system substrate-binding protein